MISILGQVSFDMKLIITLSCSFFRSLLKFNSIVTGRSSRDSISCSRMVCDLFYQKHAKASFCSTKQFLLFLAFPIVHRGASLD